MKESIIATQEKEEKRFFYKQIKLIPPEKANKLGLHTELPVFVSPEIDRKSQCKECNVVFSPLIYQAGYIIKSQHFHESKGGIYYWYNYRLPTVIDGISSSGSGWLAVLEPLGKSYVTNKGEGRAEEAFVKEIIAFCRGAGDFNSCKKLTEGYVLKQWWHGLIPICSLLSDHKYFSLHYRHVEVPYKFTNLQGSVLLSKNEPSLFK